MANTATDEQRVIVLIEGLCLERMMNLLNVNIDFEKFKRILTGKRQLVDICYFHVAGKIPTDISFQLKAAGYKIREFNNVKQLDRAINNQIKRYCIDTEHIVLVSGKSKFIHAITEATENYNRNVDIVSMHDFLHPDFKQMANINCLNLTDFVGNTAKTILPQADNIEFIETITTEVSCYSIPDQRERVVILVDASNLDKALQERRISIDMFQFKNYLIGDRDLVAAYYYHPEPTWPRLASYLTHLHKLGYELIPGGNKNVDPVIINHIPIIAKQNKTDTLIMVSGDGDFLVSLDNARKYYGLNIEIASFPENLFNFYKTVGFKFINLEEGLPRFFDQKKTINKYGNLDDYPITPIVESDITAAFEVEEVEQFVPKEVIAITKAETKPVPKPKRRQPTRAEQFVGSAKYFLADKSIREMHFILDLKGDEVSVDIIKKQKTKSK